MLLYLEHRGARKPIEDFNVGLLKSSTDKLIANFANKYNPEAFSIIVQMDNSKGMYFVGLFEDNCKRTFAFAETGEVCQRVFDFFCTEAYRRL